MTFITCKQGYYYLIEQTNGKQKILESFGKHKPIRYKPLLLQGDVIDKLKEMPNNSIDLAFADPPYNKGIDYKIANDKKKWDEYIDWCGGWIKLTEKKLKKGGSFYLMNYPRQSSYLQVKYLDKNKKLDYKKTIRWGYESNVGMSPTNFTTASRDILFYTKGNGHIFNGEKIAIPYRNKDDVRIKKLLAGGKKGKTPYDYWFFNLAKNVSKQKITNIVGQTINTPPNQLPEELIKQIILVSSNWGDTVLSLFAGSGTDLVVCILAIIDAVFENEDRIYPRPKFKGAGMFFDEIVKHYAKYIEENNKDLGDWV